MATADQSDILGRLSTMVNLGEVLYKDYLENGKTKSRARLIRENSVRIRDHLLENTHHLRPELRPAALNLIHHTACFVSQWDTYDAQHDVTESQEFSYPTDVKFPGEDVERLLRDSDPV